MKILTVCHGGSCRSIAAAYLLKYQLGFPDTVSMGVKVNSPETQNMLCRWADKIIVTGEEEILQKIPRQFQEKTDWLDIGPDIWHNPMNQGLLNKLYPLVKNIVHQ